MHKRHSSSRLRPRSKDYKFSNSLILDINKGWKLELYKTSEKRLSPLIALGNDHSCRSMLRVKATSSDHKASERNAQGL